MLSAEAPGNEIANAHNQHFFIIAMDWKTRLIFMTVKNTIFLMLMLLLTLEAAAETREISFGIVPQQAASKLAHKWTPLMEKLSKETGLRIVFKTAPTIPDFESRLYGGEYDIAYMNPYHYVTFSKKPGYRAFAKQKDKQLKGILVVRKDSPVEDLVDLDSGQLAFPSPAAFAASIITRAKLAQMQIRFTPRYVESHDSVYRSVAKGLFPAGGGVMRTFNNMEPEIRDQLRVLWTSEGYTPHAFAAHPDLPGEIVRRISDAMLALADSEEGRVLLDALAFNAIENAEDADWNDIRALDINLLDNLSGIRYEERVAAR